MLPGQPAADAGQHQPEGVEPGHLKRPGWRVGRVRGEPYQSPGWIGASPE